MSEANETLGKPHKKILSLKATNNATYCSLSGSEFADRLSWGSAESGFTPGFNVGRLWRRELMLPKQRTRRRRKPSLYPAKEPIGKSADVLEQPHLSEIVEDRIKHRHRKQR
jgi:hypothetical protein